MKYAGRYKLLKDTPTHKAGTIVRWDGISQFFYFDKAKTGALALSEHDREAPRFTVKQIQDTEWFKPMEKLRPFIPPFPSRQTIDQYVRLDAECRMVDTVDVCRAINTLIGDEEFQRRLYGFYKQQYEEFLRTNFTVNNGKDVVV